MKSTAVERLKMYLCEKGITTRNFEMSIGKSNGYMNGVKNIPSNVLEEILDKYRDLSAEWLLRGTGDMFQKDCQSAIDCANEECEKRVKILQGIYEEKIIELQRQVMQLQSEIMMKTS